VYNLDDSEGRHKGHGSPSKMDKLMDQEKMMSTGVIEISAVNSISAFTHG